MTQPEEEEEMVQVEGRWRRVGERQGQAEEKEEKEQEEETVQKRRLVKRVRSGAGGMRGAGRRMMRRRRRTAATRLNGSVMCAGRPLSFGAPN
jgi:hypothetical protein